MPSPCQRGRKLKKTNISCGTEGCRHFWDRGLREGGHPGCEQVGRKQKQSWGTKHSRAGLIVFDEAGRQRWAAAHNHCGSINPGLGFFLPFLWFCFFYPPVTATELVTTSPVMHGDVFLVQLSQQTAVAEVQFRVVSGGRSDTVASPPLTFRFRSPTKTKHTTGHKTKADHLQRGEGKKCTLMQMITLCNVQFQRVPLPSNRIFIEPFSVP